MPIQKIVEKKRAPRKIRVTERICDSVGEFSEATGISVPTIYRMMRDGRLKYVQIGLKMRKIPTTEYTRLGLVQGS